MWLWNAENEEKITFSIQFSIFKSNFHVVFHFAEKSWKCTSAQKRAILEELRLAFYTENVIGKCGEWKENEIFNSVFHIRIKVSFIFSFCRKVVKVHLCILYSGECFAPICARVSRRHEHSVISYLDMWLSQWRSPLKWCSRMFVLEPRKLSFCILS